MNRPELIDLGPVKMVEGAVPTLPLVTLADLSPRDHALEVGQTLDRFQFLQLSEEDTLARLVAAGFDNASAERAIAFRRRRQSIRVVS